MISLHCRNRWLSLRTPLTVLIAIVMFVMLGISSPTSARAADAPTAPANSAGDPPAGSESVILHTIAGDLVLTLFPSIAPRTVEQFLKLVRAGVYDTTAFVRIEPNFVVQISAHWDRTNPITDAQKAIIHKIPAEFSDDIKHAKGMLSMAREDADINSAETSFSILLNGAPHLDGKYTIFGRIAPTKDAEAILDEMVRVPRGPLMRPAVRIEVERAEVVTTSDLKTKVLASRRTIQVPADVAAAAASAREAANVAPPTTVVATTSTSTRADDIGASAVGAAPVAGVNTEIALALAFMCIVGLVSFFLQGKVPSSVHGLLNLVIVLVAAFVLLIVLLPHGQRNPWLATMLFFGVIALLKVLGRFEQARPPTTSPSPAATGETALAARSAETEKKET